MRNWMMLLLLLALPFAGRCAPAAAEMPAAVEWPVWGVFPADDPQTAALAATGPDLHWDAPAARGATRLFLSNHPETITRVTSDGKLWQDDAMVSENAVSYRLFFQHYNHVPAAIYLGMVVENLSRTGEITLSGESTVTRGVDYGPHPRLAWTAMKNVGERNAYAELSGTLRDPLPTVIAKAKRGEQMVICWKLAPGDLLGGRLWLTVRRTAGTGPVAFRLSTVWAGNERKLTRKLKLIPAGEHHPRGVWPVSEVDLRNGADPFDLGPNERDGRTVRNIRLCQPVYVNGVKVRYTDEVILTKAYSANSAQALANNGMYGALVHATLCVKNSGVADARVGLYLRYPVKDLSGVYVGAATTYAYDDTAHTWRPAATKAVDLSNLNFGFDENSTDADRWWNTQCLASYPVKAGEAREIPLTLTTDGPAMLPLAIVLRRESAK